MRVKLVLSCVLALAALSQPASAACVNRGGSIACDRPVQAPYPNATQRPDKYLPPDNPNLETEVLQPSVPSSAAAWVLTPEGAGDTSDAATVLGCGSGQSC